MRLSVIIPCKNEVGVVEHLLDSLTAQTLPPDEVIVVDSHSTDATAAAAKAYQDRLPLLVIAAKKKGATHARNEGAAKARGDALLFLDADAQLPPRFIQTLQQQVTKQGLEVAGFPQRMREGNAGLRVGARVMSGYARMMSLTPWPIFFSCMFATKKANERLHGFDPEIWIMEDYDYAYRARKRGLKFGIISQTYFYASPRRFEDKAASSIFKAAYAEIYRYTHGMRITKPLFTYDMGGGKKSSRSKVNR